MYRLRLLLLMGLMALSGDGVALERPNVGDVKRVQGAATASYSDQSRALAAGATVFFQDLLATGDRARLQVALHDGSALRLGANARLLVDAFVYPPERGLGRLRFRVPAGPFLFEGGRVEDAARPDVQIRTPAATLGIRGTRVWGGEIDGEYGVLVLAGEVEVRNGVGAVLLRRGEGTRLPAPDSAPTEPVVWGDAKVRRALDMVSFSEQ